MVDFSDDLKKMKNEADDKAPGWEDRAKEEAEKRMHKDQDNTTSSQQDTNS